ALFPNGFLIAIDGRGTHHFPTVSRTLLGGEAPSYGLRTPKTCWSEQRLRWETAMIASSNLIEPVVVPANFHPAWARAIPPGGGTRAGATRPSRLITKLSF